MAKNSFLMANNEPTNKELLQEVLVEIKANRVVTNRLSKSHDDLKISHYELRETVTELDHTIRGTKAERESGKGGMARQVDQNTKCISTMKKRQNRIVAWGSMLVAVINVAFLAFVSFFKK